MDFILIFEAFSGFNSFKKGQKMWGDRRIVAHINRTILVVESSFSESAVRDFRDEISYKNDVLPL